MNLMELNSNRKLLYSKSFQKTHMIVLNLYQRVLTDHVYHGNPRSFSRQFSLRLTVGKTAIRYTWQKYQISLFVHLGTNILSLPAIFSLLDPIFPWFDTEKWSLQYLIAIYTVFILYLIPCMVVCQGEKGSTR